MQRNKIKQFFRLLKYIFVHNKIKCLIAIVCILTCAYLGVQSSLLISTLIDDHITPLVKINNPDLTEMFKFILWMSLLYGINLFCLALNSNLMIYITQNSLNSLRNELFEHLESLPISYFDKNSHGNIMSRFTNDIDTLRQMISQSLPQIISTTFSVCCILVAMFTLHVYLALIAIAVLITMLVTMGIINKKSSGYFRAQQKSIGKVNGFINEMINGQKVIKVFNHENEAIKDFDIINNELYQSGRSANTFANLAMPLLMNIGIISYVIILICGALFAIYTPLALSLGSLAAFLILLRSLTNPVAQVSQQLNSIMMASAGASRIFELLDEDKEVDNGYVQLINAEYDEHNQLIETNKNTNIWAWKHPHKDGTISITKVTGDVRFFDVDFGYNPEKIVLHNVSLFAKPGQKIAFVGATGAGKTTITNLINRFYDIQDGKIRIDNINVNKIKKDHLRRALGMVLQDTNLFTGTIKENIRFGKLDASDEEVIEAAKLANADSFINLLPDGYDTIISGDGGNLSQGQRQLLSIARTAISNPPILILDEATSSIDTRTEALVQEGMDRLMNNRTVFVIAHRLSTVKNSKAIMVLDKGRIIERGSHDDLIAQKGQYFQLYTGAFELE